MTSRYTSQVSLSHMPSFKHKTTSVTVNSPKNDTDDPPILCKICLIDCPVKDTYRIQQCKCIFCTEVRNINHTFANERFAHFSFAPTL